MQLHSLAFVQKLIWSVRSISEIPWQNLSIGWRMIVCGTTAGFVRWPPGALTVGISRQMVPNAEPTAIL
jgi:hypothetical protein